MKEYGEHVCLVTGQQKPASEMVRFVVDPDGYLVPDLSMKLPGKGLWVRGEKKYLIEAVRRNVFLQMSSCDVKISEGIITRVGLLLRGQGLSLLGLAKRAGGLRIGFTKVATCLKNDKVKSLLLAEDGALGGRQKLLHLVKQNDIPVMRLFSASELGLAFGLLNVIYVAIVEQGWHRRLHFEFLRIMRYQDDAMNEN